MAARLQRRQVDSWQPPQEMEQNIPVKLSQGDEKEAVREHTVVDYSKWEGIDSDVEESSSDEEEERLKIKEQQKKPKVERRRGDIVKIVDDEGDIGLGRINGPLKNGVYPVVAHGLPGKILWLPPAQLKDPPKKRKFYCRPCCFTSKAKVLATILCPEGCKAYYCTKCDDKVHRRFPKSLHMRERLVPDKLIDKWKPPKRKISMEARLSQNGRKEKEGHTWMEFFWGQTDEDCMISVPVPPKTKAKSIFVQLWPSGKDREKPQITISLTTAENEEMQELVDGELAYDVEAEDFVDLQATYTDWELKDFEKVRNPDVNDPFADPWPESKWAGYRVVVVSMTKKKKTDDTDKGAAAKGEVVWFKRIFKDTPAVDMMIVNKKLTTKDFWD